MYNHILDLCGYMLLDYKCERKLSDRILVSGCVGGYTVAVNVRTVLGPSCQVRLPGKQFTEQQVKKSKTTAATHLPLVGNTDQRFRFPIRRKSDHRQNQRKSHTDSTASTQPTLPFCFSVTIIDHA